METKLPACMQRVAVQKAHAHAPSAPEQLCYSRKGLPLRGALLKNALKVKGRLIKVSLLQHNISEQGGRLNVRIRHFEQPQALVSPFLHTPRRDVGTRQREHRRLVRLVVPQRHRVLRHRSGVIALVCCRVDAEFITRARGEFARLELAIRRGESSCLQTSQRARCDCLRTLQRDAPVVDTPADDTALVGVHSSVFV